MKHQDFARSTCDASRTYGTCRLEIPADTGSETSAEHHFSALDCGIGSHPRLYFGSGDADVLSGLARFAAGHEGSVLTVMYVFFEALLP